MDCLTLPCAIVDFRREEVRDRGGARINLRPRSFAVLRRLAERAGSVVTKDELLTDCWHGVVVTEDSLAQCVSEIRQALGDGGRDLIRTVQRRGYMLVLRETSAAPPAPRVVPDVWPAIAVLAFDEFSGEPGPGPLGSGFAEDIITELARNRDLRVLARHTSFAAGARGMLPADIARAFETRYVLEGSIRRVDERMIVNAQLIDGRDSCHIWAERFVFSASEVFATQEALATRIAATLFSEIRETEKAASLRRVPADLDVYELTLRGLAHKHALNGASMKAGRADLEGAIARDPRYALAHIHLGYLNAIDAAMAVSGELGRDDLAAAIVAIQHGLHLEPTLAIGHQALGTALGYADRKDEALKAAERSVALGPGDADNIAFLGRARLGMCQYAAALADVEHAIRLNPLTPSYYLTTAAMAQFALGQYEESAHNAVEAAELSPGYTMAYMLAAASLMALGRAEAAASSVNGLIKCSPGFTLQAPFVRSSYTRDPTTRSRLLDCLRRAGTPED